MKHCTERSARPSVELIFADIIGMSKKGAESSIFLEINTISSKTTRRRTKKA